MLLFHFSLQLFIAELQNPDFYYITQKKLFNDNAIYMIDTIFSSTSLIHQDFNINSNYSASSTLSNKAPKLLIQFLTESKSWACWWNFCQDLKLQ